MPTSEQKAARRGFPILSSQGQKIDWQLVADHGEQARKNHYQTADQLASRGGLSWCELHAVLHNKDHERMDENKAILECRALEAQYLAALSAAEGVKPRVKPLEFVDAPKGKYVSKTVVADTLIGPYCVTVGSGAAYFDNCLIPGEGIEACQAHFDRHILAALEPTNG